MGEFEQNIFTVYIHSGALFEFRAASTNSCGDVFTNLNCIHSSNFQYNSSLNLFSKKCESLNQLRELILKTKHACEY